MNKWCLKILKCKRLFRRKKSVKKSIDWPFFSLTPTRSAKGISTYWRAMDFALSKKDVFNIAVTGLYGAGKSSFLRTYFDNVKGVLWISLASFLGKTKGGIERGEEGVGNIELANENNNDSAPNGDDVFGAERRLELSILQQIFYKFSSDSVPYSRLRKTTNIPLCWYRERMLWLLLVIIGVLGVWQPHILGAQIPTGIKEFVTEDLTWCFWISAFTLLGAAMMLVFEVLKWIKMGGVHKVEVGGLGIEMAKNTNRSILNQNIDEIIYHFESSNIKTVIFEDIDRFNDIDIFTKLREVNLLLNNAEQITTKPIRFIYALKEELFKKKTEKVKFFDFVIPIVPVINASNSRTLLHKFLAEKCDVNESNAPGLKKFIKDISPYVSDMRLLKNICNEFYTYRKQIPDCTAPVELLGMIVFKNFFPREFVAMHQDDGVVKFLLEAKSAAALMETQRMDGEIQKCREEIERIKVEKIEDLESLQKLYYFELMKLMTEDRVVRYDNDVIDAARILRHSDWFESLRTGRLYVCDRWGREKKAWKDIERIFDPSCSYEEHLRRIENKSNGRVELLRRQIVDLQKDRISLARESVVELIARGALSEDALENVLKGYDHWQEKDLFAVLVRNGYLNERYHYYISMFYEVEGASSRSDYYFEVGVSKGVENDWEYKFEHPVEVVEDIDVHYFTTPAIMNFDLCRELTLHADGEKSRAFFGLISAKRRRSYEFVDAYLKTLGDKSDELDFFNCLMSANENYISELVEMSLEGEGWPREFVEKQVGLFIAWALRQDRVIEITGFVKTFMEETERMPDLLKENGICTVGGMVAFVKMFGLRFKRLDCKAAKAMGLLDVVIAERAYAIESNMIKAILEGDGKEVANFETRNYSVISKHDPVLAYINTEFKTYLDVVYLKCEAEQEDDLERVLNVINRENLSAEDKQNFIHHQWRKSRVDDVKKIKSDEMVRFCIDEDWLVSSWSNAGEVWNRFKDDRGPFRTYVNREDCFKELSKGNSSPFPWDKNVGWIKSLVEDEGLLDEAIGGLLSGMPTGALAAYSGENATPTRIEILVRGGRIKFTNDLYRALKSHGNDSHIMLATMCVKEFCGAYVDGLANEEDAKKILTANQLNRKYVVRVINTLKDLIVGSGDLIDEVVRFINKGNYTEFDEGVLDAALDSITPVSLQCRIIQHLGGDADEIRRQLGRLEEPYKKLAGLGSRQQISRWDGVESFLNFLKEKGVVSTTGEGEGGKIQVNTTRS